MRNWAKFVLAGLVLGGALALPASAQAQGQRALAIEMDGTTFKAKITGLDISIPQPFWIDTKADESPLEQVKTDAGDLSPNVASIIFRHPDETAAYWSELMGVIAVHIPGYTAGQHFLTLSKPFSDRCKGGQLELFWIPPLAGTEKEALVGLCGEYNIDVRQAQPCTGGIIAAVAVEKPEGVLSAYHEWCTAAFAQKDDSKWPVSRDEIEAHARQLQQFTDFTEIEAPKGPVRAQPNEQPAEGSAGQ